MAWTPRDIKDMDVPHPNRFLVDGVQKTIVPDFGTPTEAGTPVNKALLQRYEDYLKQVEVKQIGSTINYYGVTLPTEYILANGSAVSKTDYADLFQVFGTRFNPQFSQPYAPTRMWVIGSYVYGAAYTYGLNGLYRWKMYPDEGTGRTFGAMSSLTLPTSNGGLSYTLSIPAFSGGKMFMYIAGGELGDQSVKYAEITESGVSTWNTTTSLPNGYFSNSNMVIYKNYVYIIGGRYNTDYAAAVVHVYRAQIQANGSLGAWTACTNLPASRSYPFAAVVGDWMFVFGGFNGGSSPTEQNTVWRAPINTSTGVLGSWTTLATAPVAASTRHGDMHTVVNNNIIQYSLYNGTVNISTGDITWSAAATTAIVRLIIDSKGYTTYNNMFTMTADYRPTGAAVIPNMGYDETFILPTITIANGKVGIRY